jgi:hypothetical protein
MPWAKIARVLELARAPVSVAAAIAFAAGMTMGPFRELPEVRAVVFGLWFVLALVLAIFVLTALLAFAEHAADHAERAIRIPTAVATYRAAPRGRAGAAPHAPPGLVRQRLAAFEETT